MQNKKSQRGAVLLLELLVCLMILQIVFVMASPSALQMMRFEQSQQAKKRVLQIRDAEITLANCAAFNCNPALVGAVIPPVGDQQIGHYIYRFETGTNSWSLMAIPDDRNNWSWFTDQSGILRGEVGVANASSQPFQ